MLAYHVHIWFKHEVATHGGCACAHPAGLKPQGRLTMGLSCTLLIAIRYYSISLSILYGTSFLRAFPPWNAAAIQWHWIQCAILYLDFHSACVFISNDWTVINQPVLLFYFTVRVSFVRSCLFLSHIYLFIISFFIVNLNELVGNLRDVFF